jgi:hypothetical protein
MDPDDSEAAFGGADAVQKTSDVVGHGTDPDSLADAPVEARVPPNGDFNWLAWIAVALAVILTIAFGLGAFG